MPFASRRLQRWKPISPTNTHHWVCPSFPRRYKEKTIHSKLSPKCFLISYYGKKTTTLALSKKTALIFFISTGIFVSEPMTLPEIDHVSFIEQTYTPSSPFVTHHHLMMVVLWCSGDTSKLRVKGGDRCFLSEVSTFVTNFESIITPSLSGKCWKESNVSQSQDKTFFCQRCASKTAMKLVNKSHQLGGLYGSLKGNKQNMYNLNLWVKSVPNMHDSKDRTVAFTL